jgi:DNA-binding LytR/AlgR family response regulator
MNTEGLIHVGSRKSFDTQEIIMLEAYENYTKVHLVSGQVFVSSTTLKIIENRLKNNFNFIRTHRGYIVNINYITEVGHSYVLLGNKYLVNISRRRKNHFYSTLNI